MKITYKQLDRFALLLFQIFFGLLALYFVLGIALLVGSLGVIPLMYAAFYCVCSAFRSLT